MTILVTGGAGYIGSHMVLRLLDADEDVVVIDNLSTGFVSAVDERARLYQRDLADTDAVNRVFSDHEIEAVIHFAGSVVVPESVSNPLKYYQNNTSNTARLLQCAISAATRYFIFSSTAAVYGNVSDTAVTEDDPVAPESPYGWSKLMSEQMLHDTAATSSLTYTILRYFNVAGADPEGRTGQATAGATHLIKVCLEVATGKRDSMEVFGTDYPTSDGTCIRDYIHVSDLADIHYMALLRMRRGGSSLLANCGYGHGNSVLEVIEQVKSVTHAEFPVDLSDRRPGDPASIIANPARVRAELDWKPKHASLAQIVEDAYRWENRMKWIASNTNTL